jgi:glycerol-3-phosphate dehydrogenase
LVTAISNRYTVARGVAERAVDMAYHKLGWEPVACRTALVPLHGGDFPSFETVVREVGAALPAGLAPGMAHRLARNYGSAHAELFRLMRADPGLARPIAGSDVLRAEVAHAVRSEMAAHLGDCVFNRTELGTAGHPGDAALEECATLVGAERGWTSGQCAEELEAVRRRFLIGLS